jgi:YD repeat-containing protein
MEKFFAKALLVTICVTALFSCTRDLARKSAPNTVNCRIKQLIFKSPADQAKTGSFTYDAAGNPISYEPAAYGAGALRYEFRYNKSGHLTDYIGYSPAAVPLTCEFWVRYTYKNNRIVRDSIYYYSNYGATLTSFAKHIGVTQYEYDQQERISRITYKQYHNGVANGVVGSYKFDYNEAGNLITPGATYDDKVSIYRTSKIWMFLSRNYSNNNIKSAVAYNSNGLPVAFANAAARSATMRFFESIDLSNCEVLYECPK